MLVDGVYEHLGQRLVSEPGKKSHPAVQVRAFVITTHTLVIGLDNLDEGSHDLREENDTNKHENDSDNLFVS